MRGYGANALRNPSQLWRSTREHRVEGVRSAKSLLRLCSPRDGIKIKIMSISDCFLFDGDARIDMQGQISFCKKILWYHLQFIKYFWIRESPSLQSDREFPWMVLLLNRVLWSHLALPEKPRWFHLYNLGSVIPMSIKSHPKYAS